ncbi:uncharacterized protein SPAPADRAFT_144289 [Spathaspora passalidarum NRRL Y-27907]|uniref:Phosphoribulokinase/uridine kinase domain-containing protein n=1 Tax=Spathaspora passalidarum (strain NRRL Y-27907 / 11-Y1) TaxID=619300 RepID=G3AV20_SPAPN|nr:uncharacterized protein SPAPADRAFT_144289 [Spathaspora passalidarum NRRL Y-27907]EGW30094.1 hypothetical protein SPAPADRAFT_144289 [Spathaspora passalidarum NRRL Y-27907]
MFPRWGYTIALTSALWLFFSTIITHTHTDTSTVHVKKSHLDKIVKRVYEKYHSVDNRRRLVISLAGIPGSGKSTLAQRLLPRLERYFNTVVLPMDGFHLSREELARMDDPQEAFARRGAPFTFNPRGFIDVIKKISDPAYTDTVYAPSFDHAVKDPVDGGVTIGPDAQVVIVEGNYVSLKDEVWDQIESLVDDTWFLQCDLGLAKRRIVRRHIEAGISSDEQEAIDRAEGNDLINARYIIENSKKTKLVIVDTDED